MSLKINSTNLTKALITVSKFCSTKQQNYILNNILFEKVASKIILKATDLETSVILELENVANEDFVPFAISGKELVGFVSSLPVVDVNIEILKNKIKLVTDSTTAEFSTLESSEFPRFSKSEEENVLSLSKEEIQRVVNQVSIAVSTDSSRPALQGIYFDKAENLQIVAVDGFRLAKLEIVKDSKIEKPILIQPKIFAEALNSEFENASLHEIRNQNSEIVQIELRTPDTSYFTRIIDANFPDYKTVIPQGEMQNKFRFDKQEMLQNLKIVNNIAKNLLGQKTILKLNSNELTISAQDPEKGVIETSMIVENLGNAELVAAFNIKYLQDALKTFEEDDVVFQTKTGSSPALFTSSDESYLHVVMPMRVD